jgi:hypothetical protein
VRRVGQSLLGPVGAVASPALLTDRNPQHEEAHINEQGQVYWQPPMLNRSVDKGMTTMLSGPTWEEGQTSTIGRRSVTLREESEPVRRETVTENATPSGRVSFTPASSVVANNDGNLDETINEDFKRNLASQPANHVPVSVATQIEGRLNIAGIDNIASVLAGAINTISHQNAQSGQHGADTSMVTSAIAGVLGISPVEHNGKVVQPVEHNIARFQLVADQALRMGLSGRATANIIHEIKSRPDGHLPPDKRESLIKHQRNEGHSWNDSVSQVQRLEHVVHILPDQITAYGFKNLPQSANPIPVVFTPPIESKGAQ